MSNDRSESMLSRQHNGDNITNNSRHPIQRTCTGRTTINNLHRNQGQLQGQLTTAQEMIAAQTRGNAETIVRSQPPDPSYVSCFNKFMAYVDRMRGEGLLRGAKGDPYINRENVDMFFQISLVRMIVRLPMLGKMCML